jgi:D-glycero-alpha-D-manno-heptose-7-phosphate kinase
MGYGRSRSLRGVLAKTPVVSRAPCRVDMGGGWDLPQLATGFQWLRPSTVNITIDIGVSVTLLPWSDGVVRVESTGFSPEESNPDAARFDTPLGSIMAAVVCADVCGVNVVVNSDAPRHAGLAASSAGIVATLRGLTAVDALPRLRTKTDITILAHRIESSLFSSGLQDVAAAVHGGANQWLWEFQRQVPFRRVELLGNERLGTLSESMCLAYLGSAHSVPATTGQRVAAFLDGSARSDWLDIVPFVWAFARAVRRCDWRRAAEAMNEEVDIRCRGELSPIGPEGWRFVRIARRHGCGARHTGRGGGGCMWAIGDAGSIQSVRGEWAALCSDIENGDARLLEVRASGMGVHLASPGAAQEGMR